ncbi:hypothetical protein [Actinomycetospora aeridis]|uniref:Uncharacterized protein n=1 Tax=Actinomycetospora aeridis TaxID=3129231 RepID=A0ABU8N184_9PSEU
MVAVTHSVVDTIGNQPAVIEAIRVRLVSGATSPVVYRATDGAQVRVDERQVLATNANSWSVDLIRQSELRPLGSRYEVDQFLVIPGFDERQVSTLAFTVPDGAGPFRLVDCLVSGSVGTPIVASLNPRKSYDPAIQYNRLDVVAYQSKSYVALGTSTGQTPPVSGANDYWQLLGAVEAQNGTSPDASTGTKGVQRIRAGTADAPLYPWEYVTGAPVGGDLPEATTTARTSALGTPANLLGKINRYDTSGAAISQTLPAATVGAVAAFGWDAADQNQTRKLTLAAASGEFIGTGSVASFDVPFLGELIVLHCTTAGRWRISGGYIRQTSLDRRYARRALFHDDFAGKADGALPSTSDSGHEWYAYPANGTSFFAPIISSGAMTLNPSGAPGTWASYSNVDFTETITRLGAEFETGPFTTPNGSLGIILWGEHFVGGGAGTTTPCHFGITPNGWTWYTKAPGLNGGALTKTAEGNLSVPLVAGTRYRVDILLDRVTSQAFLFLPDGTIVTVTDPAIAAVEGKVVCYEPFGNAAATDPKFRVRRVWADGAPAAQAPPQDGTDLMRLVDLYAAIQRLGGPNIQVFTSSGTWTKPAGRTMVEVIASGGGQGGASGRRGAAGTVRGGGAGGPGGGRSLGRYRASDLPSTVNVTVGAGGAGAAAVTTDDTDGASGSLGGVSTFGAYLTARAATVSAGGGTTAGGTAANGGTGTFQGGVSGVGGSTAAAVVAAVSTSGSGGGGGGGGVSAANAGNAGATGYGPADGSVTSYAGGAGTGANGTAAATQPAGVGGPGGGGGGGNASGAGGTGGAGGFPGGGGGGGGASVNGSASGAGGAGAAGVVLVIST